VPRRLKTSGTRSRRAWIRPPVVALRASSGVASVCAGRAGAREGRLLSHRRDRSLSNLAAVRRPNSARSATRARGALAAFGNRAAVLPNAARFSIATGPFSSGRCRRRAFTRYRRISPTRTRRPPPSRRCSGCAPRRLNRSCTSGRNSAGWRARFRTTPRNGSKRFRSWGFIPSPKRPACALLRRGILRRRCWVLWASMKMDLPARSIRSTAICAARPAACGSKPISSAAPSRSAKQRSSERPARGRNLALTLDSYLQFETERALAAQGQCVACAQRHGDHPGPVDGRDSRACERAGLRPRALLQILRRCAPRSRDRGFVRTRFDLQTLHGGRGAR